MRSLPCLLALSALIWATGCKKEESANPAGEAAPPAAGSSVGTPASTPSGAPMPALPAAEVAPMIGFGASLPTDFETLTMVDAAQIRRAIETQPWWPKVKETFGVKPGDEGGVDPDDPDAPVAVATKAAQVLDLFTTGRVTIATGPQTAAATASVLKLSDLMNEFTTRAAILQFASEHGLYDGEAGDPSAFMQGILAERFDEAVQLIDGANITPMVAAFEVTGREEAANKLLAEMAGTFNPDQLPPFIKREEVDLGEDGKFVMISLSASEMVPLEEMKENMSEMASAAQIEKLHAAIAKKTLTFGFGLRKNHILFYAGPDKSGLRFVTNPAESMAARQELALLAECKGKSPFFVMSASQAVNASFRQSDPAYLTRALSSSLKDVKGLGDVSDLIALSNRVGSTLTSLMAGQDTPFASVGWVENGIRIESLGGADSPEVDASQPLAFHSKLAASPDTVLLMNSRANPAYLKKIETLFSDVGELAYEIGRRYAGTEGARESGLDKPIGMFKEKMLPHVKTLWTALVGGLNQGLGQEGALVMDIGGTMPKLPAVPEAFIEKGRMPRIAIIRPVTDPAKITGSWKDIEPAIRGIIDAIPQEEDKKIRLPDPFNSKDNGLTTYFYGFSGITNDDFMPAVSISDSLFFVSSSKTLAESLAPKLAGPAAPDSLRGTVLEVRFGPLAEAGRLWLDLVEANAEAVISSETERANFLGQAPQIRQFLTTLKEYNKLNVRRHPVADGRWRTSIQLDKR